MAAVRCLASCGPAAAATAAAAAAAVAHWAPHALAGSMVPGQLPVVLPARGLGAGPGPPAPGAAPGSPATDAACSARRGAQVGAASTRPASAVAGAALAGGGALGWRAGRRRAGRRRWLLAQRAAPESQGQGAGQWGAAAVEDLQHAVARLEAANAQLRQELRRRDEEEEAAAAASGRRALAGGRNDAEAALPLGTFQFPDVDLRWPLEFLQVVAPGACKQRQACGDWLSLFRNAAPYIAAFRGGSAVIHVPSFMLDEPNREGFKGVMEDVAFCSLLGLSCVVVTSVEERLLQRLQQERPDDPGTMKKHSTRFVLDERALEIAKQEAGFARVEVESALSAGFEKRSLSPAGPGNGASRSGAASAGLFPMRGAVSVVSSTNFFTASPMGVRSGVDYGYAGVVRSVNSELLQRRLSDGDIVSLTPLGASPSGELFFVSSEELAATVAQKIRAIKLVYITRGQRLIDVRDGHVLAGIQLHDAQALLAHLEGNGAAGYSAEEQASDWFLDFVRQLRLLCSAVSPKGVRRGHLVDPSPGALLQEFYTTDGSGTVVAQDLYQGLGRALLGDAVAIHQVLAEDAASRGDAEDDEEAVPPLTSVEAGCAAGEFFVWKRDEVVLGCGQLTALQLSGGRHAAELRRLAVAEGQHDTHALALFGYAERAAAVGGAALLAAPAFRDSVRASWLEARGFREPTDAERTSLPGGDSRSLLLKPLGEGAVSEAEEAMAALAEEQRKWGATEA